MGKAKREHRRAVVEGREKPFRAGESIRVAPHERKWSPVGRRGNVVIAGKRVRPLTDDEKAEIISMRKPLPKDEPEGETEEVPESKSETQPTESSLERIRRLKKSMNS